MKLAEYQKTILAWLAFIGQVVNALVVIVQNVPLTQQSVELISNGQNKNVVPNLIVGVLLGLSQAILPRIQSKKE